MEKSLIVLMQGSTRKTQRSKPEQQLQILAQQQMKSAAELARMIYNHQTSEQRKLKAVFSV